MSRSPSSASDEHPERVKLLATYGADGLRRMLGGVAETLRAAGRPLELGLQEEPELDKRIAELRAAATRALAETDGEPGTDEARVILARAVQLLDGKPHVDLLLDLSEIAVKGRGRERFAPYEDLRLALEQTALNVAAVRDRDLLQELLELFDAAYQRAKDAESALDFEDLQLRARDLLSHDEAVRSSERLRFRSIMVDEFQDTNRLQCEIVDQFDPEELFFVGDEFQSIYRFRHADVEVFRERRAGSEGVLPLRANYRSRPELLDVVNELFAADFGEGYEPLVAAGRFPDPARGPAVELLVNDKRSYKDSGGDWRRGEARAAARRVRELCDAGEAAPGEIVFLFAAGTDAEVFEEELRAVGLPTYRAAGRGYFAQQQVLDVLAYLRLLHNRYDDEAVAAVLASPLVGVSNDALVLLRRAASRRPLFAGLERQLPQSLSARDEQLFRAFRQRYDRLIALSATAGLERLIDQIVSEHDYDLAVLAQHDGRRRYANLRKLGRLARSYEALRGRDVEGFVRFVFDRQASGAHEAEAFAEEEGGDAVRLLTIHAAKGLEFRVVVVADAGRDRPPSRGEEIICRPDGLFGFKVLNPATGKRRGAFDYEAVRSAEQAAEEAERLRLYYVAMTRAIDRLLVSGSIDPSRGQEARTPMAWVLDRLGPVASTTSVTSRSWSSKGRRGCSYASIVTAPRPRRRRASPSRPSRSSSRSSPPRRRCAETPVAALPPLELVESPPAYEPRRLSYSALATFDECPAKFYARYVAGMRERRRETVRSAPSVSGRRFTSCSRGSTSPRRLFPPTSRRFNPTRRRRSSRGSRASSRRTAARSSPPGSRRSRARRKEQSFSFEHDGVVLHGFIDVLALGPHALVVDFKTNALEGASPEEVTEADYGLQRLVYALACFRAGAEKVEVVYQFLERPDEPVVTLFTSEDVPQLEAQLSAAIGRIRAGAFVPTPSERACADCPALDVVCAGTRLRTAVGA